MMNQATHSTQSTPQEEAQAHAVPGALSWGSFLFALVLLLAIFAFANPIWEEHDMNAWNENIWWSYLPIPLIVGLLLLVERKFSWPALGLEVMKLTFVKFVITYTMASVIWEYQGAPGTGLPEMASATDSQLPAFEVRPVPQVVNPYAASDLCRVTGTLRDAQGQPMAGALIFVNSGLEGVRFAPPAEPARFENRGQGFATRTRVIQTHQVVSMESAPGELHTAVFDSAETQRRVLNVAVIPGEPRELMFDAPLGPLTLSCSVHGEREPRSTVLSLHHPFWTRTDESGAFRLEGVAPGSLGFAVEADGHVLPLASLELPPGSDHQVQWSAPAR